MTNFDAFESHLANKRYKGDFIVGEFSLADLHWAPYVHCCELAGRGELVSVRPNVAAWWQAVKGHKSTSKENFIASSVLPTMDEIRGRRIRSVSINA